MSNTVWAFEVDSDVKQKAVLAVIVCPKRGEMFAGPLTVSGAGCWRDGLA